MTADHQLPPPAKASRGAGTAWILGDIFATALRRLGAAPMVLVWVAAIYLVASLALLALVGLGVKVFGQFWLAAGAGVFCGVIVLLPLRLFFCHLAYNLWLEGQASVEEAAHFTLANLRDALGAGWRAVIYEGGVWIKLAASFVPGLGLVLGLRFLLPFLDRELELSLTLNQPAEVAVLLAPTLVMAVYYCWEPGRRILTFLYRFNAFEVIEGDSAFSSDLIEGTPGVWSSRFAHLFHQFGQKPCQDILGRPLGLAMVVGAIWLTPLVFIWNSQLFIMPKLYLTFFGPFFLRFLLSFCYTVGAAGYYRQYLSPLAVDQHH